MKKEQIFRDKSYAIFYHQSIYAQIQSLKWAELHIGVISHMSDFFPPAISMDMEISLDNLFRAFTFPKI